MPGMGWPRIRNSAVMGAATLPLSPRIDVFAAAVEADAGRGAERLVGARPSRHLSTAGCGLSPPGRAFLLGALANSGGHSEWQSWQHQRGPMDGQLALTWSWACAHAAPAAAPPSFPPPSRSRISCCRAISRAPNCPNARATRLSAGALLRGGLP